MRLLLTESGADTGDDDDNAEAREKLEEVGFRFLDGSSNSIIVIETLAGQS